MACFFSGFNAQETGELERQSYPSLPEEFESVLSSANGASFFPRMIDLWGLRKPEARRLAKQGKHFSLVSLNRDHERPENSAPDTFFPPTAAPAWQSVCSGSAIQCTRIRGSPGPVSAGRLPRWLSRTERAPVDGAASAS